MKQIKTDTFLVCHLMYIVEIGCFVSCLFGSLSSYQLYILVHFLLCLWRKNITRKKTTLQFFLLRYLIAFCCVCLCMAFQFLTIFGYDCYLFFPPTTILQYISLLLLYIFNLSSFICWFGEFSPNANVTFRYNCTFIYCLFIC